MPQEKAHLEASIAALGAQLAKGVECFNLDGGPRALKTVNARKAAYDATVDELIELEEFSEI